MVSGILLFVFIYQPKSVGLVLWGIFREFSDADTDNEESEHESSPRWHTRPTKAAIQDVTGDASGMNRYRDLVDRATAFDVDDAFRPLAAGIYEIVILFHLVVIISLPALWSHPVHLSA